MFSGFFLRDFILRSQWFWYFIIRQKHQYHHRHHKYYHDDDDDDNSPKSDADITAAPFSFHIAHRVDQKALPDDYHDDNFNDYHDDDHGDFHDDDDDEDDADDDEDDVQLVLASLVGSLSPSHTWSALLGPSQTWSSSLSLWRLWYSGPVSYFDHGLSLGILLPTLCFDWFWLILMMHK